MMLNASFPAEVHKKISDTWLTTGVAPTGDSSYRTDENGEQYVDCTEKADNTVAGEVLKFRPRGISMDTGEETGKFFAVVRGFLWNENLADDDVFSIPSSGVMHSLAFKRIYRDGTDARNIFIYG